MNNRDITDFEWDILGMTHCVQSGLDGILIAKHSLAVTGNRINLKVDPLTDFQVLQGRDGNRVRNQIDTELRPTRQILDAIDRQTDAIDRDRALVG